METKQINAAFRKFNEEQDYFVKLDYTLDRTYGKIKFLDNEYQHGKISKAEYIEQALQLGQNIIRDAELAKSAIKPYTKEEKAELLKQVNKENCTVTMIHDGVMGGQFAYGYLKDKEKVAKFIKETFDIDVPKDAEIKFLNQDWDIDEYTENGIRLYVAELALDKEGIDIIDFCIDAVLESNAEFDKFIRIHN